MGRIRVLHNNSPHNHINQSPPHHLSRELPNRNNWAKEECNPRTPNLPATVKLDPCPYAPQLRGEETGLKIGPLSPPCSQVPSQPRIRRLCRGNNMADVGRNGEAPRCGTSSDPGGRSTHHATRSGVTYAFLPLILEEERDLKGWGGRDVSFFQMK